MMKFILFAVIVGFITSNAIECPQGAAYISINGGNDTTGNGTSSNPFQTFGRALSFLVGKSQNESSICVFPGKYISNTPEWYNITNLQILPTDLSNLPTLDIVVLSLENCVLNIGDFYVNTLALTTRNVNATIHDIRTESPNSSISIFYNSSDITSDFKFNNTNGIDLSVDSLSIDSEDPIVSITHSTMRNIHVEAYIVLISNSILQSQISTRNTLYLSIVNCSISHVNVSGNAIISQQYNYADASPIITIESSRFINNTVYSPTQSLSIISILTQYPSVILYIKDNFISCNEGYSSLGSSPLKFFDTTASTSGQISGNVVDQRCPYLCPPGNELITNGLQCGKCKVNWFSPGGTVSCIPCPAGTADLNNTNIHCTQCEAGKINPNPAGTCSECSRGTPNSNSTLCVPCPHATYAEKGICVACKANDDFRPECPKCSNSFFFDSPTCHLSMYGIIVIACAGAVLVLLIILIACYCHRRRANYSALH